MHIEFSPNSYAWYVRLTMIWYGLELELGFSSEAQLPLVFPPCFAQSGTCPLSPLPTAHLLRHSTSSSPTLFSASLSPTNFSTAFSDYFSPHSAIAEGQDYAPTRCFIPEWCVIHSRNSFFFFLNENDM